MSHSSIYDAVREAESSPNAGDGIPAIEGDLTPEMKAAIIARAKEIIAGRTQPPAMIAPPEVAKFLHREFANSQSPPTPEGLRRITDRLSLEAYYAGRPVAYFTTADGSMAVLAAGEFEIESLLRGLSEEEGAKVVITDTE